MQIIGVDLHTRQQTVALLKVETGEIIEKTLPHEDDAVREFYSIPSSSINSRNHCIEPLASIPTRVGPARLE